MENNPNVKGNVAEMEVMLAAVRGGVTVYKPVAEHGRADLVLEIGDKLHRVQCKWGRLLRDGDAIVVKLSSSRYTSAGQVRTTYGANEIDLVAVYCGALDRCYLLPERLFVDKSEVWLRLTPPRTASAPALTLQRITSSMGL